ncbi:uncharacterized protein LOC143195958 [Rhynchophorus ferrugineus]|uniref:Serine protease gd N-terminal domain-containing protein n=1 Tax=Rhynchophorus ferrugineus TaxID=354439 RepID=A0A834M5T7_RHYFE|nr:hypothetical protein GWI33_018897 [Rhynchophorus ferrugineus]
MYAKALGLICVVGIALVAGSVFMSDQKCGNVFRYVQDRNGYIYGEIFVNIEGESSLFLQVNATSYGVYRQEDKLRIQLLSNPQDFMFSKFAQVVYAVFFPTQKNIPEITQISLNGRVLCQENPLPLIPGKPVTYLFSNHRISFT